MAVLLLSADLMTSSQVAAAAERAGASYQSALSIDALLDQCAAGPIRLVMVDLATAGLDVASLVRQLREQSPAPEAILAFGPHVHAAKLAAARQAGCDEVLTRGQFLGEAQAILSRYASA